MEPITYVMQFEGEGRPDETEGGIRVSCRAHGCTISTGVGSGGEIRSRFQKAGSEIAEFESLVVPCGDGVFDETGSVSFHDGESVLKFETVGKGQMTQAPQEGVQRGAVIWRIVSGSGNLAGATGYITSNFTLTDGRHVLDHQVGMIYLNA
jgi:hypothetical protein